MKSGLIRLETLSGCGFKRDPFKTTSFETGDGLRIKNLLAMAVDYEAMISVIGARGIGKTTAIRNALYGISKTPILIDPADRERITIGDIEKEMIMALSDEHPRAGRVLRSKQLRRILGEASSKSSIVLVIEEAHRLHGQTLRSLKTLREMDWMGKRELFSVVMVGQSDPMSKRGVSEVRLRSDSVYMQGLTQAEVGGYIQATVGKVFADDAIQRIAGLADSTNFLDLQEVLVCLMGDMLATGAEQVTQSAVDAMFSIARESVPRVAVKQGKPASASTGNTAVKDILARRRGNGVEEKKAVNG